MTKKQKIECVGMFNPCSGQVSMIDAKGFTYCPDCGAIRKRYQRARRLTKAELATLESGKTISYAKKSVSHVA